VAESGGPDRLCTGVFMLLLDVKMSCGATGHPTRIRPHPSQISMGSMR